MNRNVESECWELFHHHLALLDDDADIWLWLWNYAALVKCYHHDSSRFSVTSLSSLTYDNHNARITLTLGIKYFNSWRMCHNIWTVVGSRDKMGCLGFTCYIYLDNAVILVCIARSSKPSSYRDTTNIVERKFSFEELKLFIMKSWWNPWWH